MLESQGGKCLICDKTPGELSLKHLLAVDHDHATGEVRGLLCKGCNFKLGWVEKYLPSILRYLRVANVN